MSDGNRLDDEVHRKAAAYARQASIWPAPPRLRTSPPRARRTVAAARTLLGVLTLIVVPPVLLWLIFGNPVELLPSWHAVAGFLGGDHVHPPQDLVVPAVAVALWLLWTVMMVLLAGSVLSVVAGWRVPRWRLPAPLHRLLFGLAGTAMVTLATPHATVVTATPAPATSSVPDSGMPGSTDLEHGTVTVLVGETRYEYEVKHGDTLSKIARRWLGDADRWPEICRLNRHQHVADGARLTDCDLIYPGWQLRLPADARPPTTARPEQPSRHGTRPPDTPAPTPTTSSTRAATEGSSPSSATSPPSDSTATDKHGIRLPTGSIISWTLAAAISATAALVWLQRRRRYGPASAGVAAELPAPPLPEPVATIQRHVHRHAESGETAPAPARLPTGGIGLDGPAAHNAVRGLIIAALTAGGPDDPHHRAEVVIDRDTLTELFGPDIAGWPRLHITRDFTETLTVADIHLLHRARILDEHDLTDVTALRDRAPDEEALPPLLLVGRAEHAATQRARVTLGLAQGLDITGVLIGTWPHGPTCTVTPDGRTTVADGSEPVLPDRVAVIERVDAVALLTMVREAHTGEPVAATATAPPPAPADAVGAGAPASPGPAHRADPRTRVHLRVLGTPRVENITLPGRSLRAKAAEMAVYLACHPDGADTDTIAEYLLPDVRRRQATQQIHTNASNLRHVLARAGGPLPGGYLLKRGATARYRLDPATVQVDLWELRDLLHRAQLASTPARTGLLREACDLYTAPLADGCDYDWIDPHREKARQWGTEAHLLLAEDLLHDVPQAAADLLTKATGLDRYNEDLYVKAMQVRHALGDADGIRTLLRALTRALADLDAEPSPATVELAASLRATLTVQ